MAKKIKIDVDFSEGLLLSGIACQKKDYFLAFHLNDALGINLNREKDLPYFNPKLKKIIEYPLFYFHQFDQHRTYYLISNSNPESKLFHEFRMIDYFLLIQGNLSGEENSLLLPEIRKVNGVLSAMEIDTSKIKDYSNFLLDLELHITNIK